MMSHIVQATYENGTLKLQQPLPLKDQQQVRVTIESISDGQHSLLDIPPVSLGEVLSPGLSNDDLLGEMLEGHE